MSDGIKTGSPQYVGRELADLLCSALHKAISAMAVVEVVSEEDDETLGDASDQCMDAIAAYRKTVKL